MKKAEDVKVLAVSHLTIVADYFILVSGRSDVHVKSLCDDIQKYMADQGRERLRIEGYRQGRWIVLDYGDILIIHTYSTSRNASSMDLSVCGVTEKIVFRSTKTRLPPIVMPELTILE